MLKPLASRVISTLSAGRSKNPFAFEDRRLILCHRLSDVLWLHAVQIEDLPYWRKWTNSVSKAPRRQRVFPLNDSIFQRRCLCVHVVSLFHSQEKMMLSSILGFLKAV
jgi:hypothetical protein